MSASKAKHERIEMREKHFADEVLVSYLDGELSRLSKYMVKRHLSRCWKCRTRIAGLEAEIHALTKTLALDAISADRIHSWKLGFLARVRKYEQGRKALQPVRSFKPIYFQLAGIAAVALVACLAFFSLRTRQPERLARSSNFEVELRSAAERFRADPIYQQYSYEVVQTVPQHRRITGKLSVWSEPAKKRSCLRVKSNAGLLRYAVWRPDEKHGFELHPSSGPVAQAVTTAQAQVNTASLLQPPTDPETLEKMLVQWMEARDWQPLSLAVNALSYRSGDGYLATVERRASNGIPEIRLQLRRGAFRISIEITFASRRGRYEPSLQKISFTSPANSYVLVLQTETIRALDRSEIHAGLFVPEPSFQRPANVAKKAPAAPNQSELLDAELNISYALHRAGVCMGEPIEIRHENNGRLRVLGRFSSTQRRNEVAAAIAAPATRPWIELELLTEDELLSRPAPPSPKTDRKADVESKIEPVTIVSSERSALWKKLKQDRQAADVLAAGSNALQHAWALRHLSDRYTPAEITRLAPPARQLLQTMLLDHSKALELKLGYLYDTLSPMLGDSVAIIPEPSPIQPLFSAVEKLYSDLASTLAGGQTRSEIEPADGIKPEQILVDLKTAINATRATESLAETHH